MKKLLISVLVIAALLSLAVPGALAARGGFTGGCRGTAARQYVDADGDGICDNWGECGAWGGRYYVDADGDGVCDHRGEGCGRAFVDADGDGMCDWAGTCPRYGAGSQKTI